MANFPNSVTLNTSIGRMAVVEPGVEAKTVSATLAEINAGTTVLPKIPGFTYKVIDFLLIFAGVAAAATDIRLSSTASAPVDIATVGVANAGDGDKAAPVDATTTLGAGYMAELASGQGVQIRKTGPTLTGTTGVTGWVIYQLTRVG